ncbi:unnamed protein product [Protopolystoma xenopodis]|uniref:Uncharacterized protein n=1 Tax=Protopolystoma xenopodis TaxID=117903 RepID=A0A448XHT9_9PLAT|nr:unnamed protein product [Protopolystoma xenopodis]
MSQACPLLGLAVPEPRLFQGWLVVLSAGQSTYFHLHSLISFYR